MTSSPGVPRPPKSRTSSPTSSVPYSSRTLTRCPGVCLRTFVSASWTTRGTRGPLRPTRRGGPRTSHAAERLSGGQTARKALDRVHLPAQRRKRLTGTFQPFTGHPPARRHPPQELVAVSLEVDYCAESAVAPPPGCTSWAEAVGEHIADLSWRSARVRRAPPIRPQSSSPPVPEPEAAGRSCRAPRRPAVRHSPPAPGPKPVKAGPARVVHTSTATIRRHTARRIHIRAPLKS